MKKTHIVLPERMETERLFLRPYRAGDGPMFFMASIRNHEHLNEFEWGNVLMHLSDEEHSERVVRDLSAKWKAAKYFFIGLFEKTGGEWAGQVYVAPTNPNLPEFTIGFVADINFEGKGYMTEAVNRILETLFNELNAHRVISDCHEKNIRSTRLLERCGFTREGHLRKNKKNPDGNFHGDYLYGLLRDEYLLNRMKNKEK